MSSDEEKSFESSSEETEKTEEVTQLPIHKLDMSRLIELDACTSCGECLRWCPVYDQDATENIVPRRKVIDFLKIARDQNGILGKIMRSEKTPDALKAFLKKLFNYREFRVWRIIWSCLNLYAATKSTCRLL